MSDALIPLKYQLPADAPLAGWGIVRWWEYRRLIYNGAVLLVGLFSIVVIMMINAFGRLELELPDPPLFAIIGVSLYGFCANVCYTGGWILDLTWKEPDGDAAFRRRRGLFKAGLIFSCLVTTLPLWLTLGVILLRHL